MKRLHISMPDELYQAVREVAESEETNVSELIRGMLTDTLLTPEPLREGENIRVFAISAEQLKRLNIPIAGTVVDDERLGNRVIPFPQGQGGGSEVA